MDIKSLTAEEINQLVFKPIGVPRDIVPSPIPHQCKYCKQWKSETEFVVRRSEHTETCYDCKSRKRKLKRLRRKHRHNKRCERQQGHWLRAQTKEERIKKPLDKLDLTALYTYAPRNRVLHEMGFKDYEEYRASDLWSAVRNRVFVEKGKFCIACSRPASSVHHKRYDVADLKGETLEHLVPICRSCHNTIEYENKVKLSIDAANMKLEKLITARLN